MVDPSVKVEEHRDDGLSLSQGEQSSTIQSQREENNPQKHASMNITEHADQVLSQFMHHAEALQRFLRSFLIEIQAKNSEILQKEQEMRDVKRKIKKLKAENHNLRAQLHNIVPDCQLSDAMLQYEMITIMENVSNWAEDLPDIAGFQKSFEDIVRRRALKIRMHSSFDEFAQPEILTCVIFRALWNILFQELFALKPFDPKFLREMHLRKPRSNAGHDVESANTWISTTVRDYISLPQFQTQLETHLTSLSASVREFLEDLYRGNDFDQDHRFTRLAKQIMTPASDLMVKMSCSPENYIWVWYDQTHPFQRNRVLKKHLDFVIAMDVQTHNKISSKVLDRFPERAELGTLLLVIFPALFRRGKEGEQDVLINKATILVRVDDVAVKSENTLSNGNRGRGSHGRRGCF